MYDKKIRSAFVQTLREHNLTVYFNRNNHFILIHGKDTSRIVSVELTCSTKIIPEVHGSHNNNIVTNIGHFKFMIPKWEEKTNFYVFAFLNADNHNIEYAIVPDNVLRSRFQKLNRIPASSKKAELTLWLMPDRKVYDTTNISIEAEWYWLRDGAGGRINDGTDLDYTKYLNNWNEMVEAVIG